MLYSLGPEWNDSDSVFVLANEWPTYLGGRGATSKFLARAEWQQRTEGLPEKKTPCARPASSRDSQVFVTPLGSSWPLFRRCCRCQRPVQWWTLAWTALDILELDWLCNRSSMLFFPCTLNVPEEVKIQVHTDSLAMRCVATQYL